MTTSGTYDFNLSNADIITSAYRRIGIRPTEFTQDHLSDGRTELNLWLASASNRGPNLWAVDLVTTPLLPAVKTYAVDQSTVMILDAYVEITQVSTAISPLSRSDYAAIGTKDSQGRPTTFWFDRLTSPTITMWPVPSKSTASSTIGIAGFRMQACPPDRPRTCLTCFSIAWWPASRIVWPASGNLTSKWRARPMLTKHGRLPRRRTPRTSRFS